MALKRRKMVTVPVFAHVMIIAVALAAASGCSREKAEKTPLASGAPLVVNTVPANGETSVDPGLLEIRVTFDREMMTEEMWSWVMVSRNTFPEITGGVRFLKDGKTCVAPVKLEPGKTYKIWFNSEQYQNFKGADGTPATPYYIEFKTADK